jgi:selenide,water dikinase
MAGRLYLADGAMIGFDEALWVTEAAAAPWLAQTGLALDPAGFVETDDYLRSPSDPAVFAAGDVAAMRGHPRDKSGVYAVRAGPKLAENLRRALVDRPLRRAIPQRRALALIGTGDDSAVASRGAFAAEGAWLWRLKQWIDRTWMRGYVELPEMAVDEEAMRCGGCAAKVPADVLGQVMARLAPTAGGAVEIGIGDDAALVAFPGAPPLLQTVDFFRALVGDPYLFGRIAATHALGDIYAMGGVPETALAIAALPPSRPAITEHDLFHMLKGGTAVLEAAGARLIGGHSAEAAEPALGFAVTGRTRPGRLLRKGGLRAGDRLILTKPLGTGVILAAEMRGRARARIVEAAIQGMLQSAAASSWIFASHGATACTDVTGFGLLGHLLEMLRASSADAGLDPEAIPALDGALDLLASGIASSLHAGNLSALAVIEEAPESALAALLIDPQTAGGLLAGVPAEQAGDCLGALRDIGYRAAEIGIVEPMRGATPRVRLTPGCLAATAVLAAAG